MAILSLPTPPDLADPATLLSNPARVAQVGSKAYLRVARIWALDSATAAELIAVSPRTWARIKAGGWSGRLSQDQTMRISAIIGLFKALHLYFGESLADQWVSLPNSGPLFKGLTPLAFMKAGGLPALLETRNYVDALRGGI
ncbi:MAG: antitoxin Xre-like helix-turn-helix domain-containing protein [Burkholderiaceae bacterium]